MVWLFFAIGICVLAAFVIAKSKPASAGQLGFPYQISPVLFTPAERSFLGVLEQAVASDYRVFGKVRIADVAKLKSGLSPQARQGALNRIASKHFDFLVCRIDDLSVVLAVELDDSSHGRKRVQTRDDFVNKLCQSIRLPLLRIPARTAYSVQDVRTQFLSLISASDQ